MANSLYELQHLLHQILLCFRDSSHLTLSAFHKLVIETLVIPLSLLMPLF
jgi:hypothetical protein